MCVAYRLRIRWWTTRSFQAWCRRCPHYIGMYVHRRVLPLTSLSNRSFASTWGPGIWVAIGEMFPLHARSYSASFATAGNWGWNFLLTFFTPFITSAIAFPYGYVFAGCNLLAVLVVFFFYYESAGLQLEQVDAMYCDPTSNRGNRRVGCLRDIRVGMMRCRRVRRSRLEGRGLGRRRRMLRVRGVLGIRGLLIRIRRRRRRGFRRWGRCGILW